MLNENKIKMMTKMAIYEKNEGLDMIRNANYFKGDYITFGILRTLITTTIAYALFIVLYVLFNFDYILNNINNFDYVAVIRTAVILYIILLIVFTIVAGIVYKIRYDKSRKELKKYYSRLNKLERFYSKRKRKN